MKRILLILILLSAQSAYAYEFKLQFTPQGGAIGLHVAGYQFNANTNTVTGDCSYYTYSASSGRGGHSVRTNHYNTCTWDLYGNLHSMTPVTSAMPTPAVIQVIGTETIYAKLSTSTTGRDSRGLGFVNTLASHYSWTTPNNGYAVIPDAVYTITASLVSDGDFPLDLDGTNVTPSTSGYYTPSPGNASVASTTCGSSVQVGTSCAVKISYDPTAIVCTGSPYGYGYTRIDLSLVTDAGTTTDFTEGFTITGIRVCDD